MPVADAARRLMVQTERIESQAPLGAEMKRSRVVKIRILRIVLVVAIVAAVGYAFRGPLIRWFFGPQDPPAGQQGLGLSQLADDDLTVIAEGLTVPWEVAFLPEGGFLVTERAGRLVRIGADGARRDFPIEGARQAGEGGLQGLALHPEFETNHWLYVYYTYDGDDGLSNRVERYRFEDDRLADRTTIIDGIPGNFYHDGGRLEFGPDGHLYITTGDAGGGSRAQDRGSLAGKILRLAADGSLPDGNPFGTAVYSYGHRNPQGLAWDAEGRLWSTEHGRSGVASGYDELNRVEAGTNYGWPEIQGDETAPGMTPPVVHSGPDYTWAPAGAAYWEGRILFGGLRGEALYEARLAEGGAVEVRAHFHGEFGRIRAVRIGPDGMLYFTTSNRDGRGRTREGDDKLVRVDPAIFR